MQTSKYTNQTVSNWYLNLKRAQIEEKIAAGLRDFKKDPTIGDVIFGGIFGFATAAILMTALSRVNPSLYNQVQDKEITIEQAAQNEISNSDFVDEIINIDPNFGSDENLSEYSSFIKGWEGFISTPKMLANEDYYTIGIGHRIDGSNRSREAFRGALPGKNYDDFLSGQGSINKDEAQKLFEADVPDYLQKAIDLTGDRFDSYSLNLQKNIVSATYRGSWGYSPKARGLLSEGRYQEAATEFLNSDEYRDAVKLGRRGIRKRMESVADAIRQEASETD